MPRHPKQQAEAPSVQSGPAIIVDPHRGETHTSDYKLEQRPDILLPESGAIDRVDVISAEATDREQLANLAFAEEPVEIMIDPPNEQFQPVAVDCWVNGRTPEVLVNGKWYSKPALPIGVPVTTKRKYVEVLIRARPDNVRTLHESTDVERPENRVSRTTRSSYALSILRDDSPRSAAWRQSLFAHQ